MIRFLLSVLLGTVAMAAPIPVPVVSGADQSPTDPSQYGVCHESMDPAVRAASNWCRFGTLGSYPEFPNDAAKQALKFGRQTQYLGSILQQKSACNLPMVGSNYHARVAVTSKYVNFDQGGWSQDAGHCNKCMCISILGADNKYNPGVQEWVVDKYRGISFMGKVTDRLGEGGGDSIDILLNRPYAYAPPGPDNPNAGMVNRLPGYRAFTHIGDDEAPMTVGTWISLWQFVPCSWNHTSCAEFVGSYGYTTRAPKWIRGL